MAAQAYPLLLIHNSELEKYGAFSDYLRFAEKHDRLHHKDFSDFEEQNFSKIPLQLAISKEVKGMSILSNTLNQLSKSLAEKNWQDLEEYLNPGLEVEEIELISNNLPFQLSKEVYEIYQWHNGVKEGEEDVALFFSSYAFLSLEAAIEEYYEQINLDIDSISELIEEYLEVWRNWEIEWDPLDFCDTNWNPFWFPIFWGCDRKSLGIISGDTQRIATSPVMNYFCEAGEVTWLHNSLTDMMLTITECFERKIYTRSNFATININLE
ncbi:MAG: hypothetical protein ABEI32_02730, partial [Halothece sp.]